jgi:hypothetical protein
MVTNSCKSIVACQHALSQPSLQLGLQSVGHDARLRCPQITARSTPACQALPTANPENRYCRVYLLWRCRHQIKHIPSVVRPSTRHALLAMSACSPAILGFCRLEAVQHDAILSMHPVLCLLEDH